MFNWKAEFVIKDKNEQIKKRPSADSFWGLTVWQVETVTTGLSRADGSCCKKMIHEKNVYPYIIDTRNALGVPCGAPSITSPVVSTVINHIDGPSKQTWPKHISVGNIAPTSQKRLAAGITTCQTVTQGYSPSAPSPPI